MPPRRRVHRDGHAAVRFTGVSEGLDKRYSFETIWRLAACRRSVRWPGRRRLSVPTRSRRSDILQGTRGTGRRFAAYSRWLSRAWPRGRTSTWKDVDIGSVLWHLDQRPAMVYELGGELGLAAEGAEPEEAAVEWAWLIRRWPTAPPLANSGRSGEEGRPGLADGRRTPHGAARSAARIRGGSHCSGAGERARASASGDADHRGEIRIEALGPHGEHVIVRADGLVPEEHEPISEPSSP